MSHFPIMPALSSLAAVFWVVLPVIIWLRRHADGFDVAFTDTTTDCAVLGLMGPDSARIAGAFGAPQLTELSYFKHASVVIAGCHEQAARLSYVGEAGWETTCAFGYRVSKPVALAQVSAPVSELMTHGARVQVDIVRQLFDATIALTPLFDPDGSCMKVW